MLFLVSGEKKGFLLLAPTKDVLVQWIYIRV